jgi:Bacterial regulatory helix-turn-helix protein, lysR family
MDRFSELNAFIAVVEAGGFSAAARRQGEGQPTISKAVASPHSLSSTLQRIDNEIEPIRA